MRCVLCDHDHNCGLLRLNPTGETGLFACFCCRDKFPRRCQNTDDTLTRIDDLKKARLQ